MMQIVIFFMGVINIGNRKAGLRRRNLPLKGWAGFSDEDDFKTQKVYDTSWG